LTLQTPHLEKVFVIPFQHCEQIQGQGNTLAASDKPLCRYQQADVPLLFWVLLFAALIVQARPRADC
jgi:hypothetical protein